MKHWRLQSIVQQQSSSRSNGDAILLRALQACRALKDLDTGSKIHADATSAGDDYDAHVASALVSMYSKCGCMSEASRIFSAIPERDTVLWNALLLGHTADAQCGELVLSLLSRMQHEGVAPDARTYLAGIRACANLAANETGVNVRGKPVKLKSLDRGMRLHSQAFQSGCSTNIYVISSLVDLYSRCGSMVDAHLAFDMMPYEIVITWNALMIGYAECGEEEEALRLYSSLRNSSTCVPDARSYVAALKACALLAGKEEAVQVDGKAVKVKSLQRGGAVHREAADAGFGSDVYVGSSLVCMYSKCGSLVDALRVFHGLSSRDVVAWTAVIVGCADNSEPDVALELFERMQDEGCVPDALIYLAAFKACTAAAEVELGDVKVRTLERGMRIHSQAARCGYDVSSVFVAGSLVAMYAACGSLVDARRAFDRVPFHNVVLWNSLLQGYVENGEARLCMDLFCSMQECSPDSVTYVAAIKACTALAGEEQGVGGRVMKLSCLEKGLRIHSQAASSGCDRCKFVANTLIDMYVNCGSMADARRVFDRMDLHDVTWTSLLLGYSENGEASLALEFSLELMTLDGPPDPKIYLAALKACCEMAALETGRALHAEIYRCGFETDTILSNCSVDLFSKCGSMDEAQRVFDSLVVKTDVTWSSLMTGFTRQGDSGRVFELFYQLLEEGVQASGVTFVNILTACSHAGLVERGVGFFQSMRVKHGVSPGKDHYHCLVDLYGRANMLDDAVKVVEEMPYEAGATSWRTLLGACHKWKNARVGKVAFDKLVAVDCSDIAGYKLMANIYACLGLWEDHSRITALKEEQLSN